MFTSVSFLTGMPLPLLLPFGFVFILISSKLTASDVMKSDEHEMVEMNKKKSVYFRISALKYVIKIRLRIIEIVLVITC